MSKKHFISLANAIRSHNEYCGIDGIQPFTEDQIVQLADFCKRQNSNFNREHWLGYIAGTNGPNGGKVKS